MVLNNKNNMNPKNENEENNWYYQTSRREYQMNSNIFSNTNNKSKKNISLKNISSIKQIKNELGWVRIQG